jgi:translation initiation factor IF-3
MSGITPNPKKRGYLLPPGCKDLIHVLEGAPAKPSLGDGLRINGKIKAREVRVVDERGRQHGPMSLSDALNLAKSQNVDLIEIAPTAKPPICRLIDYGKFRSDLSKKKKRKK